LDITHTSPILNSHATQKYNSINPIAISVSIPIQNISSTNSIMLEDPIDILYSPSPYDENCTELIGNASKYFDITPQIDHLLDISTPNVTIENLNLDDELEFTPPNLISSSMTIEQNNEFSSKGDLQTFYNLKTKNFKNPCISYLKINSLRGDKFTQLKEILSFVKPEILCIDETKLIPDFPLTQFHIDGYQYPTFRR